MPGIDLATLSATDLRRLQERARARGQTALAEQIEAALATRARGGHLAGTRPWSPAYDDDHPHEASRRQARLEPGDGAPLLGKGGRRRVRSGAAHRWFAAAGGLLVGVVAWSLTGVPLTRTPNAPPVAPRAMLARYEPAPPAHADAPAPPSQPSNEAAPQIAASDPAPATVPPAPPAAPRTDRCAGIASRAERMVCADPQLSARHRRLQEAYVRALNLRADPQVIDQGQSAFRQALDGANDPERLAQLYDNRIRELNAASAAARTQRGGF